MSMLKQRGETTSWVTAGIHQPFPSWQSTCSTYTLIWNLLHNFLSNSFSVMKQQKHNVIQSLKRKLIFTGKKIKTNLWRQVRVNSEKVQNFELIDLIIQIILVSQERNSPWSGSHPLHRTSILRSCILRNKINSGVFFPKTQASMTSIRSILCSNPDSLTCGWFWGSFSASKHRAKAVLHWPKFLSEIQVPPHFL